MVESGRGERDEANGDDDNENLERSFEYGSGKEYFWNLRTGVSAWSALDVVLKPPPPPKIPGLEPEEDIGDQPMWEYLREKAVRERNEAGSALLEGAEEEAEVN